MNKEQYGVSFNQAFHEVIQPAAICGWKKREHGWAKIS